MELELFDANVWFGRPPQAPLCTPPATAAALTAELAGHGVRRAIAWHTRQKDDSPVTGNALLTDEIAGHDSLLGCWALLPPLTAELDVADLFNAMKIARVAAFRLFPDKHRYLLRRVVFGALLDAIAERRVPVMLSLAYGCTWDGIYDLLTDYPNLTCILCDVGAWSADRYTYPLLDAYPRVFIETSMLALEDGGVEAAAARFGPERLLFGSGYPARYPEAAALQLAHAEIDSAGRALVAHGNLERILAEVIR